jgi:hypothetical protein
VTDDPQARPAIVDASKLGTNLTRREIGVCFQPGPATSGASRSGLIREFATVHAWWTLFGGRENIG